MFKYLRVKQEPPRVATNPGAISVNELMGDYSLPISIYTINSLPSQAKQRIYRQLIPMDLLARFEIDPITWKGPAGEGYVQLQAAPETNLVNLSVRHSLDSSDTFFTIELTDNPFNGIDLNLLLLNDPASPRFQTDRDDEGRPSLFGTTWRNKRAEEQAKQAGLAPGQIRSSLNASQATLIHLEAFLTFLGHHTLTLEPLTYASAWIFEKRGLAYVRGHKLMDDIHSEFQPGGLLHKALDGSTAFRQPEQWRTVRGRAWAIHDGILSAIDTTWNGLRMVKQIGHHAGVCTFPDAIY